MIGTAAALITAAVVGAGTQVASSVIGSKAAKGAAATQQAATDRAIGYAQDAYQYQQSLMSPYLAAGNQANAMMSRLLGPPGGARYASAGPAMPAPMPSYGAPAPASSNYRFPGYTRSGRVQPGPQQLTPFSMYGAN